MLLLPILALLPVSYGQWVPRPHPWQPKPTFENHWTPIWTGAMNGAISLFGSLPFTPFNASGASFENATLRQTFQVSQPAQRIRLRVSNTYSSEPLNITSVTIALPYAGQAGSSAIVDSTLKQVYFVGCKSVIVPPNAQFLSDPIDFPVTSQSQISVSTYLATGQTGPIETYHLRSLTYTWATFGDATSAANISVPESIGLYTNWFFFTAVEGYVPSTTSGLVTMGDSITDGYNSDFNTNTRYPDQLLKRLQARPDTRNIAVLNAGISGNQVNNALLGVALMARLPTDVFQFQGIKYGLLLEGINDIGLSANDTETQASVYSELIQNYQQLCNDFHSRGLPLFAGTLTPWKVTHTIVGFPSPYTPLRDVTRHKVNAWIRSDAACFDYIVDFDAAVRDPTDPDRLLPAYDSGDALHPNTAGYTAMAAAFDLGQFAKFANGVLNAF